MDFLKKLKSMWFNLNLIYRGLIISVIFLFLIISGVNAYVPFGFLTVVSLFGAYYGIKQKKNIQTIICVLLLLGIFNSSDTKNIFYLILIGVSSFGAYNSIKCKKKVQTIACILLLMLSINLLSPSTIFEKTNKAENDVQKTEEKKVSVAEVNPKSKEEKDVSFIEEKSNNVNSEDKNNPEIDYSQLTPIKDEKTTEQINSIIPEGYKGNFYTIDVFELQGSEELEIEEGRSLNLQVDSSDFSSESVCKQFAKQLVGKMKDEYKIDSIEIYFVAGSKMFGQITIENINEVKENINKVDNLYFSF